MTMPNTYNLYDCNELVKRCIDKETVLMYCKLKGGKKLAKEMSKKIDMLKEVNDTTIYYGLRVVLLTKEF